MSQNFSTMSDIYIPELMELDSYWQRAVEDAICDTLKGEKRLHYALRNRKKINQKLEKLGLKRVHSRLHLSCQSLVRHEPEEEQEESEDGSEEMVDSDRSRSRTISKGDSFFRKNQKSSERPLLGNGSLEKMKRSQNSFNCEPMGMESFEENLSESDKYDLNFNFESNKGGKDGRNKKIRWLHVRNEGNFENSDKDFATREEPNESEFQKKKSVKDRNYFLRDQTSFRLPGSLKDKDRNLKPQGFNLEKSLCWEHKDQESSALDRKLHLALAKRDILNKKLKSSSMGLSDTTMKVNCSGMKFVQRKRKGKKHLSPFICFYLEVYRELCHKLPVKRITEEAAQRWRTMTAKEKAQYAKLNRK